MKLTKKFDRAIILVIFAVFLLLTSCFVKIKANSTYAEEAAAAESGVFETLGAKYVTFYDDGEKLTVKTEAKTVQEALERAGILVSAGDIVEPGVEAEINADNFYINIYRARPVVVRDGAIEKYLMTASYDTRTIMGEAGITVYDGDEVKMVPNTNFLENGTASVYEITRNGGRTLTVEEEIPFAEEQVKDYNLAVGTSEVRQLGEVGLKKSYYNVLYVDNREVSRELVGEEVVREPVARVVAVGAKTAVRPEWSVCAAWAREAGVSEDDLAAALDLIYHESGCRVNATNSSSGAYGIPQALPGSKMASAGADWEINPITQIRWMAGYVSRYGGWQGAVNFWYAHGWY